MKRSWLGFALSLLLLLGAAPFKVQSMLQKSLHNEREAVAKYEACALKAAEEGYPGAAALFRAAARAEGVHAERFMQAMRDRGIPIPEQVPGQPSIGTTAENLRAAMMAETQERDSTYRDALEIAAEAKDQALVTMFDQTRDTEVEHANLFAAAARNLEEMKTAKTYYVCGKCGYTSDFKMPLCALCRVHEHPHAVE